MTCPIVTSPFFLSLVVRLCSGYRHAWLKTEPEPVPLEPRQFVGNNSQGSRRQRRQANSGNAGATDAQRLATEIRQDCERQQIQRLTSAQKRQLPTTMEPQW